MSKDKKPEEIAYRIHPMAAAFPVPSAEEYAAIKSNVEDFGFIYPRIFWKDANGDVWLIDGRTRDRIQTEFAKAGKTQAKNGAALECGAAFFAGSESEAVNYVRGLNLSRRSMDKGQRAAAAIISGELYKKYKSKEEGKDVEDEEESGDLAARVAKEAGTNRIYIFDCQKLHRETPDLLLRVLQGGDNGLSIPLAKKIAARRKQGLPDEEPEGGEEHVEVTPEEGPDPVYDGLKNEVEPELRSVFQFRLVVKSARKKIKDALAEIEAADSSPGAKNVSFQSIKADANNAIRHLEDHQPHATCPYCSGTGKAGDPNQPNKKCGECKGKKFLDRVQWKQVPVELRSLFEKKGSDDEAEGGDNYGT